MKALLVLALALGAALTGAGSTHAETRPAGDSGPTKLGEAERRFRRGIDLYKDGDFGAALVEFKRAYDLVPSFKILYNLGQVSYQRHDYAAALRYFRQYLGDGDDTISVERRREVAGAIVDLEQHVGRINLQTADDGAEVFVDDTLIGTTPLRSLLAVNAGRRKVDLVTRNGDHRTRTIEVAGGEVVSLSFPRLAPALSESAAAPPRAAATPALSPRPPRPEPFAPAPTLVAAPATAVVPVAVATPARKSTFPWKSWTLTGLLAGGAATTGVIALRSKHDLDAAQNTFPSDPSEVDYEKRRTRGFAMATDGLLIGTAVMAAISLYLTLRDPG